MAIVYSYPIATPELQDLLIGTELAIQGGEDTPRTRTFTIGSIVELVTPALDLKANIESPTFTGTVGGITKEMVGLPNVDNTTDLLKPISTETQSALDLKADLVGATFTGDIYATAFIREGGLSTQYLMANGTTFTGSGEYAFPTLDQVTTAGPITTNDIEANSFSITGGTTAQFLKANGDIDSNAYITSAALAPYITSAALAPYVPYTGATADLNLGDYYLTANAAMFNGSGSFGGHIALKQNGVISSYSGYATLSSIGVNKLNIYYGEVANYSTELDNSLLTESRTYKFPDASGILALTSNIPSVTGYVPYTGATTNVDLGSTNTITANSFVKSGGSPTAYLMANGGTSTMPTLAQITAAGAITTSTITLNPSDEDGLVINAGSVTGISSYAPDGSAIYASSDRGVGLGAVTAEGIAVQATSTNTGKAISVNGGTLGTGIYVENGGINIGGTAPPTGYQLLLSLNSAAKPSTSTWTITSDSRVKTNINPYTKGLETILAINPITYDYNGKAGFDPTTIGNIGIIAQDVLNIIPESINTYQTKLNEEDEEKTELYNFDSHALTFILINAVKQLSAEIELLKSK